MSNEILYQIARVVEALDKISNGEDANVTALFT